MGTKAQKLSKLFQTIGNRNSLTTVKFLVFDIKPFGGTIWPNYLTTSQIKLCLDDFNFKVAASLYRLQMIQMIL